MIKIIKYFNNIINGFDVLKLRARNKIPEGVLTFVQKKIVPYVSIIIILAFTLVADYAQAKESVYTYQYDEEMMDLSPAEIGGVVSALGPITKNIEEDPLTVALAMNDEEYIAKPLISETKITEEPKAPVKRVNTITYTVDPGDTISKIAWKYSLKISTIKSTNNLSSDTIRPGQKLKIPPQDISTSALASLQIKKVAGARTGFKGSFGRPVSSWSVSQVFGRTSFERWHTGIDFDSRSGRAIFASESGRIAKIGRGWGGGYGNHIVIDHGQGFSTLYGHLSSFNVSSGQWVNKGRVIGTMGTTGWSTGVHLHFEIRVGGSPKNPMIYL